METIDPACNGCFYKLSCLAIAGRQRKIVKRYNKCFKIIKEVFGKQDAWAAYYYTRDTLKSRWPEVEGIIKQNAEVAYYYARDVIKDRWPEAESTIKQDVYQAVLYARDVIKGRWLEVESIIKQDVRFVWMYEQVVDTEKERKFLRRLLGYEDDQGDS